MRFEIVFVPLVLLAIWLVAFLIHIAPKEIEREWYAFPLLLTAVIVPVLLALGTAVYLDGIYERRRRTRK